MKQILLFSSLLVASFATAQQAISVQDYEQLKSTGQLNQSAHYIIVNPDLQARTSEAAVSRYSGPVQTQSTTCNCMVPLDTTFTIVPFSSGVAPDYRNDDGSSPLITLPFSFNFFGTMNNSLYINNNGNISFGASYATFTASSFPSSSFQMIAPFWADVDTRGALSGLVYYKITSTYMIVKWENVGYFNAHDSLLSTFQLIITDGLDSIVPGGSNVSFCYGDMQWTTGDASMGLNGFGGSASTTGVNQGNGTDYFQVTQSNAPGLAFDGPYGLNDGVDFLDDQEIYFNTNLLGNVPPLVMNSSICDTIDVYTGDTLRSINQDSIMFDFNFMTPEINQTVTASLFSNAPAGAFSYVQTVNTPTFKSYSCVFRAKDIPPGIYTVTANATDDGMPAGQSSGQVVIRSIFDSNLTTSITESATATGVSVYPNPADDVMMIGNVPAGTTSVMITDVLGQVVTSVPVNGNQVLVNTAAFAPGVYFITLVSANGTNESVKFIRK
ncbi:hypothetical protein BH11BAC7_BH11BAC7_12480 [soil metagenome]